MIDKNKQRVTMLDADRMLKYLERRIAEFDKAVEESTSSGECQFYMGVASGLHDAKVYIKEMQRKETRGEQ